MHLSGPVTHWRDRWSWQRPRRSQVMATTVKRCCCRQRRRRPNGCRCWLGPGSGKGAWCTRVWAGPRRTFSVCTASRSSAHAAGTPRTSHPTDFWRSATTSTAAFSVPGTWTGSRLTSPTYRYWRCYYCTQCMFFVDWMYVILEINKVYEVTLLLLVQLNIFFSIN
jgi:hypothetical protein